MTEITNYRLILDELDNTLSHVKDSEAETFLKQIIKAEQVFVSGKGRSGFVANSFAMRLNQLGKVAHVVGESTTPSITDKDIFVIISGSGSTEHLRLLADKAKSVGAEVVLLTTKPSSPIGDLANAIIELPAGTKYDAEGSAQPLGSLFEQAAQIFLDSIVLDLMSALKVDEETMQQNHANLE
ncbi:6-phospho-3-hexuloisomerase [Staphylococcus gallinarum]|jgi:6-phospho-3-hexuloisomerase|uniref:6-phospho 3-hexuloisomerase n=1 Tax=Staphylococcus gallinarum TaxID=1293 RepID=A0ABQ0XYD1_STAGA|nr:6-phospho-3-hexuloisomerase [Staphylococcus gallinarum]KIR12356.1 6-phospho 3-hexuloisomerase [Staphylococcus gallinarum]MBU7217895.1 6-phospho-3-hexuloisomerase [Staphylococcus gallinarum]MCD8787295.1 6-phospho-3-hexuloisomerase [Staphylococcus gallinarum]MCD8793948.1 6-phospho-3-hexuloisomerase [Staphylococcus gallinarum]MCD8829695.1 6-phospho-3-hexuloisomerase [Staphylococcus gallinarum]